MKKLSAIAIGALLILFALSFMTPAKAEEDVNRAECIDRGEAALKLIKEIGNEAALNKIQYYDDDRRFHWDKGWVFVIEDEKATILAHPAFPGFVGQEFLNMKSDDGKLIFQEFIRIANTKGKGWIAYNWTSHDVSEKTNCYVLKVPDENLIVVSLLRQGPQE